MEILITFNTLRAKERNTRVFMLPHGHIPYGETWYVHAQDTLIVPSYDAPAYFQGHLDFQYLIFRPELQGGVSPTVLTLIV